MPARTIEGSLDANGLRFVIIVTRFNSLITDRLLEGALDALRRSGSNVDKQVEIVRIPGSWELPVAARAAAESGKWDAVIALGCVIRGETPHFDYVAGEAAKGLGAVQMQTAVPIGFGVLTCDTLEQALNRAGAKSGNKGCDAATAAIEMANLLKQMKGA